MKLNKVRIGFKKDFILSLIFFFLIMISINVTLFPYNNGFVRISPHPYLVIILLLAGWYGLKEGLFTAIVASVLLLLQSHWWRPGFMKLPLPTDIYYTPILSFILASVIVGELRNVAKREQARITALRDKLEDENDRLKAQLLAVTEVKEEFERRIIGQEASVHSLYKAAKELETLQEEEVYRGILKVANKFAGATKASLYMIDYAHDTVNLVATYGWEDTTRHATGFKTDHGVLGWLVKQGGMLTVKEITVNPMLEEAWEQTFPKSLVYVPITMGRVVVGILTVDEIPFLKLSKPTLRILSMIADLAVPAINNVIKFQDLKERDMLDSTTRLHNYRYFMYALENEFKRTVRNNLDLTVVILEITTPEGIEKQLGPGKRDVTIKIAGRIIKRYLRDIDLASVGPKKGTFYLMLPLTKLEQAMIVVSRIKEKLQQAWSYLGGDLHIKLNFGFSTYRSYVKNKETLIKLAEQSLRLNKVARTASTNSAKDVAEDANAHGRTPDAHLQN